MASLGHSRSLGNTHLINAVYILHASIKRIIKIADTEGVSNFLGRFPHSLCLSLYLVFPLISTLREDIGT